MGSNKKKPELHSVSMDVSGGFSQWVGNAIEETQVRQLARRVLARRGPRHRGGLDISWLSAQLHWATGEQDKARQAWKLPEQWSRQWVEQGGSLGRNGRFAQLCDWAKNGRQFSPQVDCEGVLAAFEGANDYLLACEKEGRVLESSQAWGFVAWVSLQVQESSRLRTVLSLRSRLQEWSEHVALAARLCARSDFAQEEAGSVPSDPPVSHGRQGNQGHGEDPLAREDGSDRVSHDSPGGRDCGKDPRNRGAEEAPEDSAGDAFWLRALEACERTVVFAKDEQRQKKERKILAGTIARDLHSTMQAQLNPGSPVVSMSFGRDEPKNAGERILVMQRLKMESGETADFALQAVRDEAEEMATARPSVTLLLLLRLSLKGDAEIEWTNPLSRKPIERGVVYSMLRMPVMAREWPELQRQFWQAVGRYEQETRLSRTSREDLDRLRAAVARSWASRHESVLSVPKEKQARAAELQTSAFLICANARGTRAGSAFWRRLLLHAAHNAWTQEHRFEVEEPIEESRGESIETSDASNEGEASPETPRSWHWAVFHAIWRLAEEHLDAKVRATVGPQEEEKIRAAIREQKARLLARASAEYVEVRALIKKPGELWTIQAAHPRFSVLEVACAQGDEGFLRWAHKECDSVMSTDASSSIVAQAERAYTHTLEEAQAEFAAMWSDREQADFNDLLRAQRQRQSAWEVMSLAQALESGQEGKGSAPAGGKEGKDTESEPTKGRGEKSGRGGNRRL